MIPRYSLPEMAELFSDEARFAKWLEIELLTVEAWSKLGVIPSGYGATVRAKAPHIDAEFVARVAERERITDHDVAAFVDITQEAIGSPEGSFIHHGLTSTDVVDTALSATLVAAADLLILAAGDLISALKRRALEHATTPVLGRTHGMHAEPTTFGVKLALYCLQVDRDRTRLQRARAAIAVGKLSGAVGTYSNIDPAIEEHVCKAMGLTPVPSTQVLSRDRHAEYLYACASVGATVEALATELRHLQRSEVAETEEPFGAGQKGSSAMPHKRNPITAERLVGMARVLRGYLISGLEDVALWHERDISHSSVERIVLPDASLLAYYVMRRMTRLIDGLVVNSDRMRENLLVGSYGLVFSQPVLLALVASGCTRDQAYRIVQRDARTAFEKRSAFRAVLESDAELIELLGKDRMSEILDEAFDLERSLRYTHLTIDALEEVLG
ncbi:MAG TPA: adenylosuccinate lyase [Acidimicrobiales bacterium]|nr:adenylosuccinate lyase [Acidimicrobiales bacterium]